MKPALISSLPAHEPLAVRRWSKCDAPAPPGSEVVHDHAGIAIYLSGVSRMWMRVEYTLVRGDVLLIPEGMPHCGSGPSEAERLGIMLCSACLTGAWGASLREAFHDVRRGGVAVRRLSEAELREVERLVDGLARELAQRRRERELMIDGLMSQLTAHVARASPAKVSAAGKRRHPTMIAEALDYIEKNATRAISLRDVSRRVGRSPAHLATMMKQHTGRTVVEWITHGRMALARQLLLSTEQGVEVIAEDVGFASASHFHRTFRRLHGATPGEWRQAHRG